MTIDYSISLLTIPETTDTPADLLNKSGEIFAIFDERTQDSGNISYGVATAEGRFFVKTAGSPSGTAFLPHDQRVFWLRNAVRLSASVQSQALCTLRNVIESPHGPMLVYDWVPGELIGTSSAKHTDPTSAFARFKRLPLSELISALTTVFRTHVDLCARGWLASDFYDGAMIYDFDLHQIRLVDLDMYRQGAFINDMGRMFGSTRFMAPEEFTHGARIDETTTVFTMGRCITVFLADRDRINSPIVLSGLLSVADHACQDDRSTRWQSMSDFFDAWMNALGGTVS